MIFLKGGRHTRTTTQSREHAKSKYVTSPLSPQIDIFQSSHQKVISKSFMAHLKLLRGEVIKSDLSCVFKAFMFLDLKYSPGFVSRIMIGLLVFGKAIDKANEKQRTDPT